MWFGTGPLGGTLPAKFWRVLILGPFHLHLGDLGPNPQCTLRSAVRVRLGAQKLDKTGQNSTNIEEFLAGLRFEQRGRLEELTIKFC